jgi:hypothetical protein
MAHIKKTDRWSISLFKLGSIILMFKLNRLLPRRICVWYDSTLQNQFVRWELFPFINIFSWFFSSNVRLLTYPHVHNYRALCVDINEFWTDIDIILEFRLDLTQPYKISLSWTFSPHVCNSHLIWVIFWWALKSINFTFSFFVVF